MLKKYIAIIVLSVLFLTGCATTKAPVTGRTQVMLISPAQETAMGEKSYKEVLANSTLSKNSDYVNRVRKVGKNIAKVADKIYNVNYKWEFNVIESKELNAWCMPGGKVAVYTGIFKAIENDDQLATVMSHEIAHALARHGAERMSMAQISSIGQALGSMVIQSYSPKYTQAFDVAYGLGSQYGVIMPYGREQESEADTIGLYLMKDAGYNLHEAVKLWENMKKLSGDSQPEFLSTHPSTDRRIEDIKKTIDLL